MYVALKSIHIISVVLFLGNVITGLFWKMHAEQTKNPQQIGMVFDGIIRSDRWFTLPAAAAILLSGFTMARVAGMQVFHTKWMWIALLLFGVSGLIFGVWIAPLQRRIRALTMAASGPTDLDWAAYHRLARAWGMFGIVALVTPLAAVLLMVHKPNL